ncbi:MAG: hypothetical protein F6K04_07645 [Leptolyngbya sp. SIO4C5]|uniref:hypothetical protein n=1 Tax=Sphaerothrix gracilis TaxID=3151835 RepID=UPI0013C1175E|nr:hypothetical protein [Leptolyngbya sp. SIO4C5]
MKLKPIGLFLALGLTTTLAACGPAETEEVEPTEGEATEEVTPAEGEEVPAEEVPAEGGEGGEGGEG